MPDLLPSYRTRYLLCQRLCFGECSGVSLAQLILVQSNRTEMGRKVLFAPSTHLEKAACRVERQISALDYSLGVVHDARLQLQNHAQPLLRLDLQFQLTQSSPRRLANNS